MGEVLLATFIIGLIILLTTLIAVIIHMLVMLFNVISKPIDEFEEMYKIGESKDDHETITFIFMKRNKFGRIKLYKQDIHLSKYKISDNTKVVLKAKIQKPLADLYSMAKGSKRAKYAYALLEGDLQSLKQEIETALETCNEYQNIKMEQIMLDRIPIIEATLDHMVKKTQLEAQTDENEEVIRETLEAEDFVPFQKTEMVNELNSIMPNQKIKQNEKLNVSER